MRFHTSLRHRGEAEAAQYLGMSRAWLKKARTDPGPLLAPDLSGCFDLSFNLLLSDAGPLLFLSLRLLLHQRA